MQCDVGMVFLGRRERVSMEEGDVDREDDLGAALGAALKMPSFHFISHSKATPCPS